MDQQTVGRVKRDELRFDEIGRRELGRRWHADHGDRRIAGEIDGGNRVVSGIDVCVASGSHRYRRPLVFLARGQRLRLRIEPDLPNVTAFLVALIGRVEQRASVERTHHGLGFERTRRERARRRTGRIGDVEILPAAALPRKRDGGGVEPPELCRAIGRIELRSHPAVRGPNLLCRPGRRVGDPDRPRRAHGIKVRRFVFARAGLPDVGDARASRETTPGKNRTQSPASRTRRSSRRG